MEQIKLPSAPAWINLKSKNMAKGIRIAIDGYSSTGKSTIAKALADRLDYRYIDTGAMYRAITFWALKNGFIGNEQFKSDELVESLQAVKLDFKHSAKHAKPVIFLNGENIEDNIRGAEVASNVSHVAKIAEVRKFLVKQQQAIAAAGAVVMDGRDIASVVMPDAELKIFMTADPNIRAQRRFEELERLGQAMDFKDVMANLKERDHLDTSRKESPLIQTEDALVLDNSNMTREEQLNLAEAWAKDRMV